jgi:hypothetical protein
VLAFPLPPSFPKEREQLVVRERPRQAAPEVLDDATQGLELTLQWLGLLPHADDERLHVRMVAADFRAALESR